MKLLDLFCKAGGCSIAEERFWRHVDRGDDLACWLWKGALRQNGYGQLTIARRVVKAHRLSYALFKCDPGEFSVLHICDEPRCVNPGHLFLGTQADNMRDKASKGRAKGPGLAGEKNPTAKLDDEAVRTCRRLHGEGVSLRSLARRYGVDRKTMTQAVRGTRWRHVV